jgi:WD40 repeat protein
MAMSPNGQVLATVGVTHDGSTFNSTVKVWDIQTGKLKQTLDEVRDSHLNIACSNELVAIGSNEKLSGRNGPRVSSVSLLDAKTLLLKHRIDEILVPEVRSWSALAFSPDGTRLAMAGFVGGPVLKFWDVEKQKLIEGKSNLGEIPEEHQAVACLAFSPDGTHLAAGWRDCKIRLFDGRTGKFMTLLDSVPKPNAGLGAGGITFSPDSKLLAFAGGEGTLVLWDLKERKTQRTLKCHRGRLDAVTFSKDGRWIATSGCAVPGGQPATRDMNEVALWDAKTGEAMRTFRGLTEWMHVAVFSPEGNTLVVCGGAASSYLGKTMETSGELIFFQLNKLP